MSKNHKQSKNAKNYRPNYIQLPLPLDFGDEPTREEKIAADKSLEQPKVKR